VSECAGVGISKTFKNIFFFEASSVNRFGQRDFGIGRASIFSPFKELSNRDTLLPDEVHKKRISSSAQARVDPAQIMGQYEES